MAGPLLVILGPHVNCWWHALERAGYSVSVNHLPRTATSEIPTDRIQQAVIRQGEEEIELEAYPVQRLFEMTGPDGLFARMVARRASWQPPKFTKDVFRVVCASGAKCCASPYGFRIMMECPAEVARNPILILLDKMAATVRVEAVEQSHWIIRRGRAGVHLYSGEGFDCALGMPKPFVAIDYPREILRKALRRLVPLIGNQSPAAKLGSELATVLEAAGARRVCAVVPWPGDIKGGH